MRGYRPRAWGRPAAGIVISMQNQRQHSQRGTRFFHRLGVYFGLSNETEDETLDRQRSEALLVSRSLLRIVLTRLLFGILAGLVFALLAIASDGDDLTLSRLVDRGLWFGAAISLFWVGDAVWARHRASRTPS
jgi:hypothetical protein